LKCRLCGSETSHRYNMLILRKYDVGFFECRGCQSLQSEQPHWLDEAYKSHISNLDTGAVQRNLNNFAFCLAFARIFNVTTAVDFGASDGLLCRFLRDYNIDAYAYDKYASSTYAQGFTTVPDKKIDLVTAFEVLEHFANPREELDALFQFKAGLVLVSTELYAKQDQSWWYFAKEGGQHIFFYSAQAMSNIAKKYGYGITRIGGHFLFFKQDLPNVAQAIIASQTALSGWIFQAIKSHIFLMPAPGVERDMNTLKSLG